MTLQERRELLEAELREIRNTPCARCGHKMVHHYAEADPLRFIKVYCWAQGLQGDYCHCRAFVEVGEVLA